MNLNLWYVLQKKRSNINMFIRMSGDMEKITIILYLAILIYASITDYRCLIIKDRVHLMFILLSIIRRIIRASGSINFLCPLAGAFVITIPFLILAIKQIN